MIKLLALIRRKEGMSLEDFVDYYENKHVPLIRELNPQIIEYRRNYIEPGTLQLLRQKDNNAPAELGFDVVTEIWYKDRAAYEQAIEAIRSDPRISARIDADSEKFVDRFSVRIFLVDERLA